MNTQQQQQQTDVRRSTYTQEGKVRLGVDDLLVCQLPLLVAPLSCRFLHIFRQSRLIGVLGREKWPKCLASEYFFSGMNLVVAENLRVNS